MEKIIDMQTRKYDLNKKSLKNSLCFCRLDKERSGLRMVLQNQAQIKKVDESNVKPPQFAQNFYLFLPSTLNFRGWDKTETESKQAGFAKAPQLFSKNKIKEILQAAGDNFILLHCKPHSLTLNLLLSY